MGKTKQTIVFQGDSITDSQRVHESVHPSPAAGLGNGYVKVLAGRIPVEYPAVEWTFYNRGISGNKVPQLLGRWQTDTLNLRPDYLSILIGVNDVWHGLSGNPVYDGVDGRHYERTYRLLLDHTLEKLPGTRLILGEPFLLRGSAYSEEFREGVDERREIAGRIARDHAAAWVPYQAVLEEAAERHGVEALAPDGVHPTGLANSIMADAWMRAFGALVP